MNIDEFLDNVDLSEKGSDTIVIDNSLEEESAPDFKDVMPKEESLNSGSGTEVKVSSDINSEVKLKSSEAEIKPSVFGIVEKINSALKHKELSLALKLYSDLEEQYSNLKDDEILKLELNKLMVQLNSHILDLKRVKETEFLEKQKDLLSDFDTGNLALRNKDFPAAKKMYSEISSKFKDLPEGFESQKSSLKDSLLRFSLDLKKLHSEIVDNKLNEIKTKISGLIQEAQSLIKSDDLTNAKKKLELAKKYYDGVSEEHKPNFSDIHDLLIKKLTSVDMIFQIKNLRQELGSDVDGVLKKELGLSSGSMESVPFAKSIEKMVVPTPIPVSEKLPELNVEKTNREKQINPIKAKLDLTPPKLPKLEEENEVEAPDYVSEKIPADVLSKVEILKPNSGEEVKDVSVETVSKVESYDLGVEQEDFSKPSISNFSIVDESIKRVRLSKVKIAIIEKNYALARALLLDLEKKYPTDLDVKSYVTRLENDKGFIDSGIDETDLANADILEQKLSRVETDLEKGDFDSAKKDISDISKGNDSLDFEEVVEELGTDVSVIEKSTSFADLKARLKRAKSNLDSNIVNRKITLAKHQIKKGDYDKAKSGLNFILEKDPKNRKAKKLLNMIH